MIIPRSPDFIGIGAQKAGTTWLRHQLSLHPDIWMPPLKELHYFDKNIDELNLSISPALERLNHLSQRKNSLERFRQSVKNGPVDEIAWWAMYEFLDRDNDWYRNLFSLAPSTSMVGEITPRYAICDNSEIQNMHSVAPAAKLIFILRNPVDRFWSQCKMKYKDRTLTKGFSQEMQLFDLPNGRCRGEYSVTLIRFCKYYDPSQILVVFYDAILQEPELVMKGVFEFLGLSPQKLSNDDLKQKVNVASDSSPMPVNLKVRIASAYRQEIETLAEVFDGYASNWLQESEINSTKPTVQLNNTHLEKIITRPGRIRAKWKTDQIKIFCLSMQRSGTTSVGDWLESHGLKRAGSPTSVRRGWTRLWLEGKFEEIYSTPEFQNAEILEDDPWWCPKFYEHLAERFPQARFVLLTRDPDEWFDSLCHHSGGMNPGWSDVHARIYNREAELHSVLQKMPGTDSSTGNLLSIIEHREHYKEIYQRHTKDVTIAFAKKPDRLFIGQLNDSESFHKLCDFIGINRNLKISIPCSNARTEEMSQKLALRLKGCLL